MKKHKNHNQTLFTSKSYYLQLGTKKNKKMAKNKYIKTIKDL